MLKGSKTERLVRHRASTGEYEQTFKRSRTITSDDIKRDRQKGEIDLMRANFQKQQASKRRRRTAVAFIILVAILTLATLSQYTATITDVVFDDNNQLSNTPDGQKYIDYAQKYLDVHPAERLSLLLHPDSLTDFLMGQASEVERATIMNIPFRGGKLQLKVRKPLAVWQTPDQKEYVDSSGVVFDKNFFPEPTVVLRDESGIDMTSSNVTSRRFLNFIGKVISGVNEGGVGHVTSVSIPLSAIRYVEFRIEGHNFPIKAQIDRDPASQVSDIINIVKYLDERNLSPSYVDVRLEGKGYWK